MKEESLGQVEKLKERQIGKKKKSQTDVITDEQTNGQKKIDAYGVDYVIFETQKGRKRTFFAKSRYVELRKQIPWQENRLSLVAITVSFSLQLKIMSTI